MLNGKIEITAVLMALIVTALASNARAEEFSAVVVYGDSLSDNGNLYAASGYPPAPYWNGRFSNGPVAVEQLAAGLDVPLYDFAWGGATSGIGNYGDGGTQTSLGIDGLPGMIPELVGSEPALSHLNLSTSLFVVWGGANDFLASGSPIQAAEDIDGIVSSLQSQGAQHILVPNIPNLGLTPDYYGDAAATAYSVEFNTALKSTLPSGAIYFDTFGLLDNIVSDPSAYGLTDVTDPCFNGVTVCSNPNQYLFWDGFHPTTAVDAYVAEDFAATVPEPNTLLMVATGLVGLTGALRRRRAA